VKNDAKVRPLANINISNAEEKVKVRATSRLYSSMMTPRSYMSNDMKAYESSNDTTIEKDFYM